MRKSKPNFYGIGKDILSAVMVVNGWWMREYNLAELVRAFGKGALQRGIDNAKNSGETVPDSVQAALNAAL